MSLGFGDRARIGHLYPSGGLCDFELQRMAPEGVQFVVTRMPFRDTSKASDLALVEDIETHSRLLADAQVDFIAFNCTAASLFVGPEAIRARIHAATGLDTITTIEAVIDALRALGARRLALLTPYREDVSASEVHHLEQDGFSVLAQSHLPCLTPAEQGAIPPKRWLDLASRIDVTGCDAVLFSCAGINISPVLAAIETATELPVVSSNSALLWKTLALACVNSPMHCARDCWTSLLSLPDPTSRSWPKPTLRISPISALPSSARRAPIICSTP